MCFLLSFLPGCHRVSRNVPSTLKSLNQYSLSHLYPPSPTPSYWAVSIKCIITKFVSCKVMIFFLFTMKILILSGLLTTCDSDTLRIWFLRFVNLGKTWGVITGLLYVKLDFWVHTILCEDRQSYFLCVSSRFSARISDSTSQIPSWGCWLYHINGR